MAKLSNAAKREIITQKSAFHEDIKEIVAFHDEEGPLIEMVLAPEATDQYAELRMTTSFARELADELYRIADVAQRAGWTPAILAEARDKYLPGMSDEQIIGRLDRLANRWGGFVIGLQAGCTGRLGGRSPSKSTSRPWNKRSRSSTSTPKCCPGSRRWEHGSVRCGRR